MYRSYQQNDYQGHIPTLQDFRAELLQQDEPEAKELALAIELFTHGSLNTFAKQTNVDTNNRLICYDILDLGKQLMPIGMLVVLDSILNRITQNRAKGKNTFIFIDEIYLLFQHEYSANFLFTLWKRVRKYGACLAVTMLKEKLKMMNGVLENGNYQLGQFKFGELRKSEVVEVLYERERKNYPIMV